MSTDRLYLARFGVDVMASFDNQKHRLAGSAGEEMGGLVVKKPREEFKKPSGARESVLGLDVLAREKRREQEEERKRKAEDRRRSSEQSKRPRSDGLSSARSSARDDSNSAGVGDMRISFGSSGHARDRAYRYTHILMLCITC